MDTNKVEAQFEELDESAFDELMGDVPDKQQTTPVGGEKPDKQQAKQENKQEDKKEEKESKKEEAPEKKDKKTPEEEDKDIEDAIESDQSKDDNNNTSTSTTDTGSILEAKYKGLVDRGIWQEVDFPEDFEWSDEAYGEIAQKQAEWKAEEVFDDMLEKTGQYGKTIFEHIKNGGNPDEIIELFKEARKIETTDISNEEGQKQMIRDYYKKEMKWTDAKITRFINAAVDGNELEAEAKEVKNLLDERIKEQVEQKQAEQKEYVEKQKELEQQFASNMTTAMKDRDDIPEKERKEILSNLLTYNQKLPNGRVVNQFTLDFMKLQADPQKYIDLVMFVRNPEKYMQKVEKKKETEATKKSWEFIKGSGSLKKNTGTSHTGRDKKPQGDLKIDWKKDFL